MTTTLLTVTLSDRIIKQKLIKQKLIKQLKLNLYHITIQQTYSYIINRENPDVGITDYRKPRFKSNMSYGTLATSMFYDDSGLKIIRARVTPHDDVFSLLKEDYVFSSGE